MVVWEASHEVHASNSVEDSKVMDNDWLTRPRRLRTNVGPVHPERNDTVTNAIQEICRRNKAQLSLADSAERDVMLLRTA